MRASKATGARQPGCRRCRSHHLKCDRKRPVCSTCLNTKKLLTGCTYETRPLRFEHSKYSTVSRRSASPPFECAAADSPHDGCRRTIHEPDNAFDLHNVLHGSKSSLHSPPHNDTLQRIEVSAEQRTVHSLTDYARQEPYTSPNATRGGAPFDHVLHHAGSIERFASSPTATQDPSPFSLLGTPGAHSSLLLSPSSQQKPRVLTRELDCKVFDFYVTHIGYWLDIGSPKHYFQSYVPRLAVREPLLLYACLACASQNMYLLGLLDQSAEERYNGQVLELLIPLLSSNQATSTNEILLATTVILRMAEQFLELAQDAQSHLNGAASLFMDGTDWPLAEHNLAIAAFWTHLRECIRICFLREQPPPFELDQLHITDDYSNIHVPEEEWTNRSTYLLLKVCRLCWGTTTENPHLVSDQVRTSLDLWKQHLPSCFWPWSVRETSDQAFPVIEYFESWHAVAWQFYYTAKIMLSVYFASKGRSSSVSQMQDYIESEITSPTRLLCGLCMCATNIGTNLNGSHLMAWCGQFLSARNEQSQLIKFLTDFGMKTKWPNQTSCNRLEEIWGRSSRSWMDC